MSSSSSQAVSEEVVVYPILNKITGQIVNFKFDKEDFVKLRLGEMGKNGKKRVGSVTKTDYLEICREGYAHRIIMKAPDGTIVDHINRDKSDNRKSNLRLITYSQKQQRVRAHRDAKSQFKNVEWKKPMRPTWSEWEVDITVDAVRHYIGVFKSEFEAAHEANLAMIKYHKEFKNLNILPVPDYTRVDP